MDIYQQLKILLKFCAEYIIIGNDRHSIKFVGKPKIQDKRLLFLDGDKEIGRCPTVQK